MKEKNRKHKKAEIVIVNIFTDLMLIPIFYMFVRLTVEFFREMISGQVLPLQCIFGMIVTGIIVKIAADEAHDKRLEGLKREWLQEWLNELAADGRLFAEYRAKITATELIFLSKGQLNIREMNKFNRLMSYTARENGWETKVNTENETATEQ